uniref:Uncharacterized protein n=1 Tax=Acidobacterium capsulatum TaxID=33075 RepID=A0A7V5CSA7_9BACT
MRGTRAGVTVLVIPGCNLPIYSHTGRVAGASSGLERSKRCERGKSLKGCHPMRTYVDYSYQIGAVIAALWLILSIGRVM